MNNIMDWLDREQEHKINIEMAKRQKNKTKDEKKLNAHIAKLDIEFVKMRNAGMKNLHLAMLKKLFNTF